jgi:hypothetical protein
LPYGIITTAVSPKFQPTRMTWSGSVFSTGAASIEGIEIPVMVGSPAKATYMDGLKFGGKWEIAVSDRELGTPLGHYYYVLDPLRSSHLQERTFNLVDVTSQWDVLLTQKTYPGEIVVGDLIEDLANDAADASEVHIDKLLTCFTTMVAMQGGEGIPDAEAQTYAISNSTYLAELNRVLGWFGYVLFANPYSEVGESKISLIAPLVEPAAGAITIHSGDFDLLSADFTLDYGGLHSDVVVASNETGKGAIAGKTITVETAMNYPDPTNWNLTKRFNPLFATVYRVADLALKDVAKKILYTDRMGAKALKLSSASFIPDPLWKSISWEDKNGATGYWRVTGYEYSFAGAECGTALECIQVSA